VTVQALLDTDDILLKICTGKPWKCEKIEALQCSAVDKVDHLYGLEAVCGTSGNMLKKENSDNYSGNRSSL
jgi:hypothetical protein